MILVSSFHYLRACVLPLYITYCNVLVQLSHISIDLNSLQSPIGIEGASELALYRPGRAPAICEVTSTVSCRLTQHAPVVCSPAFSFCVLGCLHLCRTELV